MEEGLERETPYLIKVRYRKGKALGSGLFYSDAAVKRNFHIKIRRAACEEACSATFVPHRKHTASPLQRPTS
jgi:hypothetical protein